MDSVVRSKFCLVCHTALTGPLGFVGHLAGIKRAAGNPNLCNRCTSHVEEGSIVELAVFFVDLSNYTNMTRDLGPDRMHEILDAFLKSTNDIIVNHDGYVAQYVGDEVMAYFNVPLRKENYAEMAVKAGLAIRDRIKTLSLELDHPLNVTIGIAAGHARVGKVGSKDVAHYSAIGDVVNRAARLVSSVSAGGMLVDEKIYRAFDGIEINAEVETIPLKGFEEPQLVARIDGIVTAIPEDPAEQQRKTIGFATTLAAIFSAPCVGYLALNAAAVGLGFGSLSMGALAIFLDQSWLRIPLLTIASIGALAILYLALKNQRQSKLEANSMRVIAEPTPMELRQNRIGIAVSVFALLIVVAEMIAHQFTH